MTDRRELNVRELLELERQIYQESIDRVLQQQEELNTGTLEEFVQRCKPFEADRERECQAAQHQFDYSQEDAQSLFEFDVQQAHDVYRSDRQQLKRKLLEGVRQRRRTLEKRLRTVDNDIIDTSNLTLLAIQSEMCGRVENLEPQVLVKQLHIAQERTRRSFNFRHLSGGVLPKPEQIVENVVNECAKLQQNRDREAAETAKNNETGVAHSLKVVINADHQEVICHGFIDEHGQEKIDETFRVGDAVVLVSKLTEEDFHGFVSAITLDEMKLVLVCGTHVRVTMARLRCGQCVLRKQPETPFECIEKRQAEPLLKVATSREELVRIRPMVDDMLLQS